MSLRMSRDKAEGWMEYFAEEKDQHYNNCLDHVRKMDVNDFIKFANKVLNNRHTLVPLLKPHDSYLSSGDFDRWVKAIKQECGSRKLGIKTSVEVIK